MARIEPLRKTRGPELPEPEGEKARGPRPAYHSTLHIAKADVHIDTPSHTPGTRRAEELSSQSPEKGRQGYARTARSSTSVNPSKRESIDPRMPHLPPA